MLKLFTPDNVRSVERDLIANGATEVSLIFSAASGIINRLSIDKTYSVLCGKGNNGGDGFCLAHLLHERGAIVKAFLIGGETSAAEKYYYDKCREDGIVGDDPYSFDGDVIIDCVFGIGFHGEAQGEYARAIDYINVRKKSGSEVYSVDIPSGLDALNGVASQHTVHADKTFVIGYYKTGVVLNDAKDHVGEKVFVDIGFTELDSSDFLAEEKDFTTFVAPRKNSSHKYDHGFVGVMGGSESFSGAIKLANLAAAACRSGAGVTRLITGKELAPFVAPYLLESTLSTLRSENGRIVFDRASIDASVSRLDSLAVGMGMTDCEQTRKVVEYLLNNFEGILIIDADGLNVLKGNVDVLKKAVGKVVITPHLGEFARLTGLNAAEIAKDPIFHARSFAQEFGVTVLLKGTATVVSDGVKSVVVDRGTAGMATAGSGDVLSGVLAAITSKNGIAAETVAFAPFVCGLAAEIASETIPNTAYIASDTVSYLKNAFSRLNEMRK